MLLGFSLQLKAQHISVWAPTHVAAGENFRVAYTINTRDLEEFRLGGVGEGLEVIAGPYTSSQSSYQMRCKDLRLPLCCSVRAVMVHSSRTSTRLMLMWYSSRILTMWFLIA